MVFDQRFYLISPLQENGKFFSLQIPDFFLKLYYSDDLEFLSIFVIFLKFYYFDGFPVPVILGYFLLLIP